MQQRIPNLLRDLCICCADSLNALLIKEDMIRRIGGKYALHGPRNSRKEAQQQAASAGFARRRVLDDNCKVSQPAAKRLRQAVQGLFNQPLKSLTLHGFILHVQLSPAR